MIVGCDDVTVHRLPPRLRASAMVACSAPWMASTTARRPAGFTPVYTSRKLPGALTRDRAVLGVALGVALAAFEFDGWPSHRKLAELYRAAGADEHIAAVELASQRNRHGERHSSQELP